MRHNRSSWLTPEIVCPKRRINQLSVVGAQVFETSMKHSDIQTNTKAHVTAHLVVGFDLVRHVVQRVTSYRLRQSQGFSSDDTSSPTRRPCSSPYWQLQCSHDWCCKYVERETQPSATVFPTMLPHNFITSILISIANAGSGNAIGRVFYV